MIYAFLAGFPTGMIGIVLAALFALPALLVKGVPFRAWAFLSVVGWGCLVLMICGAHAARNDFGAAAVLTAVVALALLINATVYAVSASVALARSHTRQIDWRGSSIPRNPDRTSDRRH